MNRLNSTFTLGLVLLSLMVTACRKKGSTLRVDTSLPTTYYTLTGATCSNSFQGKDQDYHLDKVDVWLDNCGSPLNATDVTLNVQTGPPTFITVATATQQTELNSQWIEFSPLDTAGQHITIPVGQEFYITLETTGACSWGLNASATYAYGHAYINGQALVGSDFCIKIYSSESF